MDSQPKSLSGPVLVEHLISVQNERDKRLTRESDYIAPDGTDPLPPTMFAGLNEDGVQKTLDAIEDCGGVESLSVGLSEDEKSILHKLGGTSLVSSFEDLLG